MISLVMRASSESEFACSIDAYVLDLNDVVIRQIAKMVEDVKSFSKALPLRYICFGDTSGKWVDNPFVYRFLDGTSFNIVDMADWKRPDRPIEPSQSIVNCEVLVYPNGYVSFAGFEDVEDYCYLHQTTDICWEWVIQGYKDHHENSR